MSSSQNESTLGSEGVGEVLGYSKTNKGEQGGRGFKTWESGVNVLFECLLFQTWIKSFFLLISALIILVFLISQQISLSF